MVGVLAWVAASLVSGGGGPAGAVPAGTALDFDGSNDYVTFGSAPGLGVSTFTIETWFKREGTGATTSTGTGGVTAVPLVTKGRGEADGSNLDMNYFLGIRTTDNVLVADYEEGAGQTSAGLNHPVAGVSAIPADGAWRHAAATFDGTTWRLYLNGTLDSTLVVGAGRLPRSDSIQHAGLAIAMTSTGTNPSPAGFFNGVLDEARIWNVARSAGDILAAKDTEITSASGLIGRWGMNEGSGTAVGDSAGPPFENGTSSGTAPLALWVPGFPLPDTDPPVAPTNLSATAGNGLITLNWTANSEIDLAGYNIYRSTSSPVPLTTPLNGATPVTGTSYTDYGRTNGTAYYYAITAEDTAGNESGGSAEASATPSVAAGSALDFDGTNDHVTFGTASGLGVTTFTVEAWFKQEGAGVTTSTGALTTAIPLVTKGRGEADNSNVDMNWFLGLQGGTIAVDYEEGAGQLQPGAGAACEPRQAGSTPADAEQRGASTAPARTGAVAAR